MLIQSVNNIYSINSFRKIYSENLNSNFKSNNLAADIISFSSKKYDIDSIVQKTNHCAYCGCKVYSDAQIQSLAKEMLSSKAERLRGNIRSILEKLTDAKNSQEIAVAKKMENEEQIKFFETLLDVSEKKSYLKGDAIFEQVYHLQKDDAVELLVKNMLPLKRTVDHVSPQKEEKENNSSDINLVEACYCCNHDLKKGIPFNEFYAMFPSIKNNMPPEKFEYAMAGLLDSSQSQVIQRLSTYNILKLMKNLFMQRTEAVNNLSVVDYRIKSYRALIQNAIQSCREEISQKQSEVNELQQKYDTLKSDPEFVAMITRLSLLSQIETAKANAAVLRDKIQKNSNAINDLRNQKKSKRAIPQLSEEEKAVRIQSLKDNIAQLTPQLNAIDEHYIELEIQVSDLDESFPTADMLQVQKSKTELVLNAYTSLNRENNEIAYKNTRMTELLDFETSLKSQLAELPPYSSDFDVSSYSDEDKGLFRHYQVLLEALDFIEKHPNGGSVKVLINSSAKMQIMAELGEVENKGIIVDYKNYEKHKELSAQLEKVQKEIADLKISIEKSKQLCQTLSDSTSVMSEETAKSRVQLLAEKIRVINEKQINLKIPQNINTLKAEITLLNQTIKDLELQIAKIDETYASNT